MIPGSQDSEVNGQFANPFANLAAFDSRSIDSLTDIRITAENLFVTLRATTYNYSVMEKAELNVFRSSS